MGRCDIIYKKWRGYLGIFAVVTFAVTWIEIAASADIDTPFIVVTFAVTWIEIYLSETITGDIPVVTFAVTWIEIHLGWYSPADMASSPSR